MGFWLFSGCFFFFSFFLLLLLWAGCVVSSFHSLSIFYTFIHESHQELPQYFTLGYIDDQLFAHFDTHMRKLVPRVSCIQKVEKEDPHFWEWSSQRVRNTEKRLKGDLEVVQNYYNLSQEPPVVVKVSRKVGYDGLETLVCSAYGFYPKEFDTTWRRDGEVWEEDTFCGSIANSDRTYHTWLSIQIQPKDRDHYWCYVEHAGLLEPLNLAWEESVSNLGLMVGVILVVVATATILLMAGVIAYNKKHQRDAYKAASRSIEGSNSPSSA